jgi:hypothetical protein
MIAEGACLKRIQRSTSNHVEMSSPKLFARWESFRFWVPPVLGCKVVGISALKFDDWGCWWKKTVRVDDAVDILLLVGDVCLQETCGIRECVIDRVSG